MSQDFLEWALEMYSPNAVAFTYTDFKRNFPQKQFLPEIDLLPEGLSQEAFYNFMIIAVHASDDNNIGLNSVLQKAYENTQKCPSRSRLYNALFEGHVPKSRQSKNFLAIHEERLEWAAHHFDFIYNSDSFLDSYSF